MDSLQFPAEDDECSSAKVSSNTALRFSEASYAVAVPQLSPLDVCSCSVANLAAFYPQQLRIAFN